MTTRIGALLLAAALGSAAAAEPPDYAMQWPIVAPTDDASAYVVQLDDSVYRAVQRPDLLDVDVVDATGRVVPATVQHPVDTVHTRRVPVPWFIMPVPTAATADDWRLIAELDARGRVRQLHTLARASARRGATLLLVKSEIVGEPVAIELDWRPGTPFDRAYRVEASDDFETWVGVGQGRLFDLQQGPRRLTRQRLTLTSTPSARYFRLLPGDGQPLPELTSVSLVLQHALRLPIHWVSAQPITPTADAAGFRMHGRFPVRWIDLRMSARDAGVWRVQSRDSSDAPWVTRVDRLNAYRVGGRRSPPHRLDAVVRDRYWRLVGHIPGDAPHLQLGYAPERVLFVGAGRPPYRLVAGSVRSRRAGGDVLATIDTLRGQDANWQPAVASLGAARVLRGDAALRAARDWKTWSLWAVLAVGVVIVGGFAVRLLRENSPSQT